MDHLLAPTGKSVSLIKPNVELLKHHHLHLLKSIAILELLLNLKQHSWVLAELIIKNQSTVSGQWTTPTPMLFQICYSSLWNNNQFLHEKHSAQFRNSCSKRRLRPAPPQQLVVRGIVISAISWKQVKVPWAWMALSHWKKQNNNYFRHTKLS